MRSKDEPSIILRQADTFEPLVSTHLAKTIGFHVGDVSVNLNYDGTVVYKNMSPDEATQLFLTSLVKMWPGFLETCKERI